MGLIATTLQRFIYDLVLVFNRILAALFRDRHLHNARFAHPHELANLLGSKPQTETRLLLGVNHFNQVLRVRPTKTRRELGNMLVVAPTRGGKGLLAVSQLLTWPASVIVNDIRHSAHLLLKLPILLPVLQTGVSKSWGRGSGA